MKKQFFTLLLFFSTYCFSQIPTFSWVKQLSYPGFGSVTGITNMTTDAAGNVYIIGSFQGTVDINPGAATLNITAAGSSDIFIEKLSSSGAFMWVKTIGGTGLDNPNYIHLDSVGNIYITGSFENTVDFNPGASTTNLSSVGVGDIFLLKLDNSGNYIFSKRFGGSGNEYGTLLRSDVNGNIYLSGSFYSPSISFSGNTVNFLGNFASFLVKLDPVGTASWAVAYHALTKDMALDDTANIYLTGSFYDINKDLDPGPGTFYVSSLGGNSDKDAYILKLTTNGTFVWVNQINSSIYPDEGTGIAIDSNGDIISAMNYKTNGVLLQKFSPGGTLSWNNFGIDNSGSSVIRNNKLIVDAADQIFLSGTITGGISWSGNQGNIFGSADVYIQKFSNAGQPIVGYEMVIGSFNIENFSAFAIDYFGGLILIGDFQGTVDFNYSSSAINNLTSVNNKDIFILKLSQPTLGSGQLFSEDQFNFKIQPNPFTNSLTLEIPQDSKNSMLTIYSLDGKIMYQNTTDFQLNSWQINTTDWPKGIYFANLKSKDQQKNYKIIKN